MVSPGSWHSFTQLGYEGAMHDRSLLLPAFGHDLAIGRDKWSWASLPFLPSQALSIAIWRGLLAEVVSDAGCNFSPSRGMKKKHLVKRKMENKPWVDLFQLLPLLVIELWPSSSNLPDCIVKWVLVSSLKKNIVHMWLVTVKILWHFQQIMIEWLIPFPVQAWSLSFPEIWPRLSCEQKTPSFGAEACCRSWNGGGRFLIIFFS